MTAANAAMPIDIPSGAREKTTDTSPNQEPVPVKLSFSPNWPVRVVMFRIIGTALIFSAAGMWVIPGALHSNELALIKLGVSVFFFFCGLALLMRNHEANQPDAYFDPIRKEVRVLQLNDRGHPQAVLRRSYDSLGRADFSSNAVEFFDPDGSLIMRLLIDDPRTRAALKAQLDGQVILKTR